MNAKSKISTRRLGGLFQLVIDEKPIALVLYQSGVEKIAEILGKATGAEVQLEPRKKAPKPAPKADKPAKIKTAKVKKVKTRPVTEATEPEAEEQDPPRVVAGE
jgi:hypothetical protein